MAFTTESNSTSGDGTQQPQPLRDKLILIADDAADNRLLLELILRRAGARTAFAMDGAEAVSQAINMQPDAVIMDIQMPKLDGYSATRRLRELGFRGPIISCTARGLREDISRSMHSGCNAHLTKPLQRAELFRLLDQVWAEAGEHH